MERLQAALEKARERRSSTTASAPRDLVRPARQSRSAERVDQAWSELRPLEQSSKKMFKRRLVTTKSQAAGAPFDVLRTKVSQICEKNDWRRVAITSPAAGSGKSTVSSNLAIALSRRPDTRVVLIDVDLRRPSIAKLFGYTPRIGVGDILSGQVEFSEAARCMSGNLAVAGNAASYRDPSDLFLSQSTPRVLDEIQAQYQPDMVIFDLPPAMVNDDAGAFLQHVDCALLVAEAEVSSLSQVDVCEREIAERTNVLGTVLNKCRFKVDGHGYYSYVEYN